VGGCCGGGVVSDHEQESEHVVDFMMKKIDKI
jgi:hypothetical protein